MNGNLGTALELMIGGSSFDNPGLMVGKPHQVATMLLDNHNNGDVNTAYLSADDYFYNDSLLDLLHNYELTQAILGVIVSSINDILAGSDPLIDVGDTSINKDVNSFIKDVGLTQNILDHLLDDLYFGQRAFWVDINARTILKLENDRDFFSVKYLGLPYRFQFNKKDDESKKIIIEHDKIANIYFNPILVNSKKSKELKLSNNEKIDKMLLDLEYYRGLSILKSSLYLIFLHFLKSLLSMLLTLKNSVKPDILQATINPGNNPELNITEAINNIEALLNLGDYTFDLRATNSYALIGALYNSLMNSVKVVPGLTNYTSFEMLLLPDLTAKIEALLRDLGDLKTNILNNMGIPEELFGGTSNRWEVISRSSRFYTFIKSILNLIVVTYKLVTKNYIDTKYSKVNISLTKIKLNIDSNNYLSSSAFNSRITVLSENLLKVMDIINAVTGILDAQAVNKKEALKYIKTTLETTDSSLAKIINLEGTPNMMGGMGMPTPLGGGMDMGMNNMQGNQLPGGSWM